MFSDLWEVGNVDDFIWGGVKILFYELKVIGDW